MYITSLNESNSSAIFLPFAPALFIAKPNNTDITIKAIKLFVDKSPANELVDNTFTVLSKIFSSISSFTVLSKTSLIASVSLGFTKFVKDVVKKPNNTAIIDVIKNIIIVLVNILLNLFFSFILEMDDVIVKNIKGTIITKEEIPKQIIIPQEVILEQPILSKNEVQDQPIILKEEKDEIFVPESKKTVMNFYDNEDDDDFDLPSLK